MIGAQFLASGAAKASLKDGQGEHVYGATGSAGAVVGKNPQGQWKIDGFQSKTDFDISDFVTGTSLAPPAG
jgi:hypothetical protein